MSTSFLLERLRTYGPRLAHAHVMPIDEDHVSGRAFFPVGRGYDGCELPIGGIMFLGHDFGNERDVLDARKRDGERPTVPTWRGVNDFLGTHSIDPKRCFFTNALLGARRSSKNIGIHPARENAEFMQGCREFFIEQVEHQQPSLVLPLGDQVVAALAAWFPELLRDWSRWPTFTKRHIADCSRPRPFLVGTHSAILAPIVHPCHRRLNLPNWKYGQLAGREAEQSYIADAFESAEVLSTARL